MQATLRLRVLAPLCLSFFASLAAVNVQAATQSFAVIGDAGRTNSNSASVRSSIARSGIQDLVLPGDNLYSGSYENVWRPWSDFKFSVVAIGNHNNGYQNEINFFAMPSEYYAKTFPGGLRFLVLNSDNTKNVTEQMNWLEGELQKDAVMTFLVWHHPPYTLTSVHNWQEKARFQTAARALMKEYSNKITAVLLGHDHMGAFYCADEIPLIVSGAVQETRPRETRNYIADDQTSISAKWVFPANTPNWARLDVDAAGKTVGVSFIRASDDKVLFSTQLSEAPQSSICRSASNPG